MNEVILLFGKQEKELSLISSVLSSVGYRVDQATVLQEAVRKAAELSPDVILMDIDIAIDIGVEKLIGDGMMERAPMVAIASPDKEELILNFLRQGGSSYLIKPRSEIELLVLGLREFLEKRELIKKNRFLASQLKQVAITDPLTNTYNYRHLHTKLSEEIVRSKRYGHSFCIFLIDIDDFKLINRQFGHLTGDSVLRTMAELLCANVRGVDSVFRYGGDEFVILLPETHKDNALGIAMRLLIKIRNTKFHHEGYSHFTTVSIGASMFPQVGRDTHSLLLRAEHALARAKGIGGDTIFFD